MKSAAPSNATVRTEVQADQARVNGRNLDTDAEAYSAIFKRAPSLTGAGEADLDRAAGLAHLEGRLGCGGRAAGDRPVGDPENAAMPRAGQAAVGQLAVGQRT